MSSDQVKTVFKHNLTNLYIVKLDCPSNKVFAWDSELSCGGGKKMLFIVGQKKCQHSESHIRESATVRCHLHLISFFPPEIKTKPL